MGNILSFLFPKPAPAALEAQEELEEVPAAPAKEAVEDQPPTAPARTKKIVEAPITQTVEAEPVIESIGSIEDAAPEEPTPEIIQPEPIKQLLPEPLPIIEPIKEPEPEPKLIMELTPEPGSFCGTVGAEPTPQPIKEPTPEPTKAPTPEPIKEPTPEPIKESTTDKIEEPQAGIANIVAEAVDNLVSVSEEVIDDDKPATVEGAAELRDFLEKPKVAVCEPAEDLPLAPPELANIGVLECKLPKEEKEISILEWTGPLSEPTKESLPEPPKDIETPKELLESLKGPQTTSSIASLVADTVGKVSTLTEEVIDDDENDEELIEATSHTSEPVKPIVDSVIVPEVPVVTKSDEVVEVIGSIQDDTKEEAEIKPSGGAALLRDILDDK